MTSVCPRCGFALHQDAPPDLLSWLETYARDMGTTVARLRSHRRDQRHGTMRRDFATAAVEEGYSTVQIGRALNRDHSTVCGYLRVRNDNALGEKAEGVASKPARG